MPQPSMSPISTGEPPPPPPLTRLPTLHQWEARRALVEDADAMGAYRLLLRVAEGPVCEVFVGHNAEAADQGYGHDLLVKRVRREHANDTDVKDLLMLGARQAVNLNHLGLPMVLDAGEHEGLPYILTDVLVRGVSLEWICQGWLLPPEVALHVVARAAEALDYAHNKVPPAGFPLSIVHHDLFPGRIIVGQCGEVKVTGLDTGLAVARLRYEDEQLHRLRRPYLPPEQQHAPALDARANVYSLGAILYRLLTGAAPAAPGLAGGRGRLALAARVPAATSAGLLAEVELVVRRAMEPDPQDRYPSADALKQQLWRLLFDRDLLVTGRHLSRLVDQMLGD